MTRTLVGARALLELDSPAPRSPERDAALLSALQATFPQLVSRQSENLPDPTAPFLVLQSTASQLLVAPVQSTLDVRFYGEYSDDLDRCVSYLDDKLNSLVTAWEGEGARPSLLGVAVVINFPSDPTNPESPAIEVLRTHLRYEVNAERIQDAQVRIALRASNEYFVNLVVSNYENRVIDRPIFAGQQMLALKPWEGRLESRGKQFQIDVNNRLKALRDGVSPVISSDAVRRQLQLLNQLAARAEEFVGSAIIPTDVID